MSEYIESRKHRSNIFLADGVPRNQENIEVWDKQIGDKVDVRFLLLFDLDGETMLKRLLSRAERAKKAGKPRRPDD